jgi:glycosyltransferase involved in cell wall biosynthesis
VRVLILSPYSTPPAILRSLGTSGVEVIVAEPSSRPSALDQSQLVRVATRGDPDNPLDLRWSRRALRNAVRDVGPELLHVVGDPWSPTAEAGAAAARQLKIPYVVVGMSSIGKPRALASRWQADRVRDGAAALAGTVRPALDHLMDGGIANVPTAVIPPGGLQIPAPWEPRPDPHPVVFSVVGRLVPERGVDLVLDALSGNVGEWRLRVAGTGPIHESLEQHAQRLGLSSRIEWLGAVPRDGLAAIWASTDVVLAPSRSTSDWVEPSGQTVMNAMAHGVAPVVSRCGALPDVVADGGMIVEENDLQALTRAIQAFVAEPWRCRAVGTAARQRVLEQYTDSAVADRMLQLWRRARTPTG